MALILNCTCGKKLKVADSVAGRRVLCPTCGASVEVPAAPERPEAAQPIDKVGPARCASCGLAIDSAPSEGPVRCPSCLGKEDLDEQAKRDDARRRLARIQENFKEQHESSALRPPPNAGFAKTRESAPTMIRSRREEGTVVRSAPPGRTSPPVEATLPVPKQEGDDLDFPAQEAPAPPAPEPPPPVPAPVGGPRPGAVLGAGAACAGAALLFAASYFNLLPGGAARIVPFAAAVLCSAAAVLLVMESGRK